MNRKKLHSTLIQASIEFRQLSQVSPQNLIQKEAYISQNILDVLVWKYTASKAEFKLISSNYGYNGITSFQFDKFLDAIKPCFQDYFIDYFTSYIEYIIAWENIQCYGMYQLQGFIPMKLGDESFFYCTLYITTEITSNRELIFYMALLPLKKHTDEVFSLSILKDGKEDKEVAQEIKDEVNLRSVLTEEQTHVFNLMLLGYSSRKIAKFLNKKQENILKYNLRINDRLSSFFDINFNSANDAATYYKKCFY